MLMDVFYDSLDSGHAERTHFHRFMRNIHDRKTALGQVQDPLKIIAGEISDSWEVLCLDEFMVTDITDAMILGGLMEALFDRGVTLVATSNILPDELYKDGLQRQRFLPAIALVKQHTEVINIDGGVDYRLRTLERDGQDLIRNAPMLAYLPPKRFARIEQTYSFPFPDGFER